MGRRIINFSFKDTTIESDFGNWIMLLVYAKSINQESFLSLKNYNQQKDIDCDEVVYNEEQLKLNMSFIDVIVNALRQGKELREIYPESDLIELLDQDSDFEYVFLYEGNNIFLNNNSNIDFLIDLRTKIFSKSLQTQKPHLVYVL